LLDAKRAADLGFGGLSGWLQSAEALWNENSATSLTLEEQFNYYGKLSSQFPISSLRVVYAKAGTQPAAYLLRDLDGVIDHSLYWAQPNSEDEGYFLLAILNSEEVRGRVAQLQARGLFGARHFDKVMFTLPIPRFNEGLTLHRELAEAGREAERFAAGVDIPENTPFQRARRVIRDNLRAAGVSDRIDALVRRLLGD
jgi:hypothetical protein